jgi:hypothetical protein
VEGRTQSPGSILQIAHCLTVNALPTKKLVSHQEMGFFFCRLVGSLRQRKYLHSARQPPYLPTRLPFAAREVDEAISAPLLVHQAVKPVIGFENTLLLAFTLLPGQASDVG